MNLPIVRVRTASGEYVIPSKVVHAIWKGSGVTIAGALRIAIQRRTALHTAYRAKTRRRNRRRK